MPGPKVDGDGHGAPGKPFDPRPYLRRLQIEGQATDYLDVKWRLVWLRAEHPDARVTTEHVVLTESLAVFRAVVEIPSGGSASAHASESREDDPGFVERAETKAIGRALALLGYGIQYAPDLDLSVGTSDEPGQTVHAAPVQPVSPEPPSAESPAESFVEPTPIKPPAQEPERKPAAPSTRSEAQSGPAEETFTPADISWTKFWNWARSKGYSSRSQVEELLGHPLGDMTPAEVYRELMEYRQAQEHDNSRTPNR